MKDGYKNQIGVTKYIHDYKSISENDTYFDDDAVFFWITFFNEYFPWTFFISLIWKKYSKDLA